MEPIKTILHPTDFSRHSQHALRLACALAREQNARLIILHCVPPEAAVVVGPEVSALRRAECYQQDLNSYRDEMANKLEQLPVSGLRSRPERLLKEGDAATVILHTAQDASCDLVVMGTHGRTGAIRKLMGSVAEEVSQKALCPVVTVKVPLAEPKPVEETEEAEVVF